MGLRHFPVPEPTSGRASAWTLGRAFGLVLGFFGGAFGSTLEAAGLERGLRLEPGDF